MNDVNNQEKRKFWTTRQILHDIGINLLAAFLVYLEWIILTEFQNRSVYSEPRYLLGLQAYGALTFPIVLIVILIDIERALDIDFFEGRS